MRESSHMNRDTYVSTWDERTSLSEEVCRVTARALLQYSDRAEVDAMTDYYESFEGRVFLDQIERYVATRHAEMLKTDPRSVGRENSPALLDVPLDLSDPEQVELFVFSSSVSISATLFDRDEQIFQMSDSGLTLVLSSQDLEREALVSALRQCGISFADNFLLEPRRSKRWWQAK